MEQIGSRTEVVEIKKKKAYDPTAWELYQQEHPDWNWFQQLGGFIALTLGMIVLTLSAVYAFSKPECIIVPALLIGGFVIVRKLK